MQNRETAKELYFGAYIPLCLLSKYRLCIRRNHRLLILCSNSAAHFSRKLFFYQFFVAEKDFRITFHAVRIFYLRDQNRIFGNQFTNTVFGQGTVNFYSVILRWFRFPTKIDAFSF